MFINCSLLSDIVAPTLLSWMKGSRQEIISTCGPASYRVATASQMVNLDQVDRPSYSSHKTCPLLESPPKMGIKLIITVHAPTRKGGC